MKIKLRSEEWKVFGVCGLIPMVIAFFESMLDVNLTLFTPVIGLCLLVMAIILMIGFFRA
jgi:hypothetical protein